MVSDVVANIARIALYNTCSDAEIRDLLKAFSLPRLRAQMAGLGLCEADADDREVARLYFSGRCRMISPNAFFDEVWYVGHYPEVAPALKSGGLVSGFVHFIRFGLRKGLWPNRILWSEASACAMPGVPKESLDETSYLLRYPSAAAFIDAFPVVTATEHYNLFGRFLGYAPDISPVRESGGLSLKVAEAEFDDAFYIRKYLTKEADQKFHANPFEHYVKVGMKAGYSPNEWFQEDWYRAFYKEVREAIESGWLPSGFYHFMLSGRMEGRLPKHDLALALEARMPGVTNPALMGRTEMLRNRLAGLKTLPRRSVARRPEQTIWVFLPSLNPDIMYGGYRAVIALICALYRDGHTVSVVCVDEDPNRQYFLWSEKSASVRDVFSRIQILDVKQFSGGEIGSNDLFMAYSVWDLIICNQLVGLTDNSKPFLLAQEYEPIFYDSGAQRALCDSCYRLPHFPIINTRLLANYFEKNRIGVFSRQSMCRPGHDYAVFEHKINALPSQTARSMRMRGHRVMALYARPEAHAARNLFEIAVLALETLCTRGAFGPEWRFIGLGSLTKLPPVPLGGGHELKLTQKMPEDEYKTIMSELDIGLSLMYAPHPSVVPFEFATTGAIVVTNTYENRSAEDLQEICGNIVACDLSVDSLVGAIERAIGLVEKFERRERQALTPAASSWDDIFSPGFIASMLSAVQAPAREPESTVVSIASKAVQPACAREPLRRGALAAANAPALA